MTTFLIGFMGSGKSTIAKLLRDDFIDMDQLIVNRIGMSISDYFETYGEAAFRQVESEVLKELTASGSLIATGGGIVTSDANLDILQAADAEIIYLKADFDTLHRQISLDQDNVRPLFVTHSREDLEAIFENRISRYEAVATQIIDISGKTPAEIVKEIQL